MGIQTDNTHKEEPLGHTDTHVSQPVQMDMTQTANALLSVETMTCHHRQTSVFKVIINRQHFTHITARITTELPANIHQKADTAAFSRCKLII